MNNFLMFLIKICQLRIEKVCRVKEGKIFLNIFLLFECKKVTIWASEYNLGPQKWGLGGLGPQDPPGSATGPTKREG